MSGEADGAAASSLSDTEVGETLERRLETILGTGQARAAAADADGSTATDVPDDTTIRVLARAGDAGVEAVEAAARRHGRVHFVFERQSLVAATLPADEVATFASSDAVTAIDVDAKVELSRADPPTDGPPPRQATNGSDATARTTVARPGIDSWGYERIDADLVHESGIDGSGVRVAIIDTGIDPTAGMQGKIVAERDFAPNSQFDGDDPTDYGGHGTNVAGIVAANQTVVDPPGDARKRVHGVAPGVSLVNAKISGYRDEMQGEPTADQRVGGLRDGEVVTRPVSIPNEGRWLRVEASWNDPDNDVRIQLLDGDGDVIQTLTDYNGLDQPVETALDGATRTRIEVNGTTSLYAEPVAEIRVIGEDVDGTADVRLDVEKWKGGPARLSNMARAINWASGNTFPVTIDEPADVISLSYGGGGTNTLLNPVPEAMDTAVNDGVVVVTSAGNDGPDRVTQVKGKRNIITVGASNRNDDRTGFSQTGDAANRTYKPDVLAPGDDIPSAGPTERIPRVDGSYNGTVYPGTSQATPHVTGVAALYIEMYQRVHGEQPTPRQVRAAIVAGTQRSRLAGEPVDTTYSDESGMGIVDAYATYLTFTATGRTTGETDNFTVTTPRLLPDHRLARTGDDPVLTGTVYHRDQGDPVNVTVNRTDADGYGPYAVAETGADPGETYTFGVTRTGGGGLLDTGERYALATHYPPATQQFEGERLEGYSFGSPVALNPNEPAVYAAPVDETVGGTFVGNRGGVRAIAYYNASGADVDVRVDLQRGPTVNTSVDTPVVNTEQVVSREPDDSAKVTFTAGDGGTAEFAYAANYPLLPLPSNATLSNSDVVAGNALNPSPVTVDLSVEAAGRPYVGAGAGTPEPSQFVVRVNGTRVPTNLTVVTELSAGEYRVGFVPPAQPTSGTYELSVAFTDTRANVSHTATAVDPDGVEYTSGGTTAGRAALALVIDRSGSMGFDPAKIRNAREAGKETVALLNDREYAAVIGFESAARTEVSLSLVADNRSLMQSTIDGFVAGGATNIGDALSTARATLTRAPNGTSEAVLLLSDGKDGGSLDPVQIAGNLGDDGTPVYTVALGNSADRQLLEEIADESGGKAINETDPQALADIFADIRGQISGTSRVKSTSGTVNASANVSQSVPVGENTDTTSIRVATTRVTTGATTASTDADTAATLPRDRWPRVELYYPNDTIVPYNSTDDGVVVDDPNISYSDVGGTIIYRIDDPETGDWSYRIDNDATDEALSYQADVRASTATTLDVVTDGSEFVNGTDTRVVATLLRPDGGVSGLDANVTVSLPDGGTRTVSLSETDDGRYVGSVPNDENGSVTATVTVTGENVSREVNATWRVVERQTVLQATNTNATTPAAPRGGTVVSEFRLRRPVVSATASGARADDDGTDDRDTDGGLLSAARELARSDRNLSAVEGIDEEVVAAARALRERASETDGPAAAANVVGPQAVGSGTTVVVDPGRLTGPNGTVIPADRIAADPAVVSLTDGGAANVSLEVRLPDTTPTGTYNGQLELFVDGSVVETTVTVNVTAPTRETFLERIERASRQWQTASGPGRDYYEREIADELTDAYFGNDSDVSLPSAHDGPTVRPPTAADGGEARGEIGATERARVVTPAASPRGGGT